MNSYERKKQFNKVLYDVSSHGRIDTNKIKHLDTKLKTFAINYLIDTDRMIIEEFLDEKSKEKIRPKGYTVEYTNGIYSYMATPAQVAAAKEKL